MNSSTSKGNGFSARRKTVDKALFPVAFHGSVFGTILWAVTLIVIFFILSLNETSRGETPDSAGVRSDSIKKPDVSIKVNRHFDEEGNLIGYDSMYSSFYSSHPADSSMWKLLRDRFIEGGRSSYPFGFEDHILQPFLRDTVGIRSFFDYDLFFGRKSKENFLKRMMEEIDSMKTHFYFPDRKTKSGSAKDISGVNL